MGAIKMVEVTRSDFIESIHYGAAVLINSDEKILKEWGNSNNTDGLATNRRTPITITSIDKIINTFISSSFFRIASHQTQNQDP